MHVHSFYIPILYMYSYTSGIYDTYEKATEKYIVKYLYMKESRGFMYKIEKASSPCISID